MFTNPSEIITEVVIAIVVTADVVIIMEIEMMIITIEDDGIADSFQKFTLKKHITLICPISIFQSSQVMIHSTAIQFIENHFLSIFLIIFQDFHLIVNQI